MLKIALLVLFLAEDASVRMTLTDTADMDSCLATRSMVRDVLDTNGYTILAALCDQTDLSLTPFEHGVAAEAYRHRYKVIVSAEDTFELLALTPDAPCAPIDAGRTKTFCATSSQAVVTPE